MAELYDYSYTNIVLTILSTLLTLVIAGFAWIHRRTKGADHLLVLSLIGAIWGLSYLIEPLIGPDSFKRTMHDIQYAPISFLAPVFFLITLVFTGNSHRISKATWLLYVIPVITAVMIATNDYHQLFRKYVTLSSGEISPDVYTYGPWYWIMIVYSIILMMVSVMFLFYAYRRAPRWARGRISGLLVTSLIITGAAVLSLPAWMLNVEVNLTLIALLMALAFLSYSLLSRRMLEVIPLAASTLLSQISDAVVTLNSKGEIIDYNDSARALPQLDLADHLGESFIELLQNQLGFKPSPGWAIDHSEEIRLGAGDDSSIYDMRFSPLIGDDQQYIGLLVVMRDITWRRHVEIERVRIQERYQAILQNANYAIVLLDENGRIREFNEQLVRMSGYSSAELQGILLQDLAPALPAITMANYEKTQSTYEVLLKTADGNLIPTDVNIIPIAGEEDVFCYVTLQDIRERKSNEFFLSEALTNVQSRANDLAILRNVTEALNQTTTLRNALLPVFETVRQVTNSSSIWCFLVDPITSNYQRVEYHPSSKTNKLVSKNQTDNQPLCLTRLKESDNPSSRTIENCQCSAFTGERYHRTFALYAGKLPLGVLNFTEETNTPINDNMERLLQTICGSLAVAIDRLRLFKSEYDQQRKLATTDPLTDLFNRRMLFELGESEFARSLRYGREMSAIMLDCDGFKRINDTYGHAVGDQVLIRLSEISRECIRKVDILARYGGDEFMILLPETSLEAACVVAERLHHSVNSEPFKTSTGDLSLTASIGVACMDKEITKLGQLLERADYASYVSKDSGGNRVTRWASSLARKNETAKPITINQSLPQ